VFSWRSALGLAVIFIVVAVIYWVGFTNFWPQGIDYTGFILLGMLGIAMAFGFAILLRNSREL
jgi:hypothetical protein